MIKNKNIIILAAVLVVLLGVSVMQKSSHRKVTNRSATETVLAGIMSSDQLGKITLAHGESEPTVVLVAGPTGWLVASAWDARANQDRIDTLLRNLSDLRGEFRSDRQEVLADYQLDDASAVRIRAYDGDGKQTLALDIGGKPEGAQGNFIRRPDSPAAYLSPADLLTHLGLYGGPGTPLNRHFLDLQAFQADRLAVDRLALADQDGPREMIKEFAVVELRDDTAGDSSGELAEETPATEIDRTTWEWKLTAPRDAALAKSKADGVLSAAVSVRAIDVDDPNADPGTYGLGPDARTVTLVLEDGSSSSLAFGAERAAAGDIQAGVWMQVQGEPTVWVVSNYVVTNIFKTVTDLLPE